ncbi:MAG: serine/threonine protein kinase, partial [Rhodothermia bacterium]
MDAEQLKRAMDIVPDALELPKREREAFLDEVCRSKDQTIDLELRAEIVELITASSEAEAADALRSPVAGLASEAAREQGMEHQPVPDRVGPWRPLRRLGSGGMGIVYEAVRADESFTQKAALKVIRPGFVGDFRDRFIRERAVLAGLTHPGIARLLDGGLSEDGMPYLAMELVDGRPLTQFATDNGLRIHERLNLFLQVCDAVSYAHQNLVVHRDLKPANIYVHEVGQRPVVKLLDFGIARLLESEDDSLTVTGTGPLTPAFAAPEQLTGAPITTATDIYSLGVVLYTLLTGQRPYDLDRKTASQAERIVCTTIPEPPSAAAVREEDRLRLKGDLDQIVLKALKKEPGRRYASVLSFSDDIRRYLNKLPVLARPDTLSYRLQKFVQRNRTAVLSVATAVILILAMATAFAVSLTREREKAETAAIEAKSQAERAQAVASFLERILRAPNQRWYNEGEATGPETPVKAVLDEAAGQIDREFADRPDLSADLHHIIGDSYMALRLFDEAGRHHMRVLEIREQIYAPPHPKLAEAIYYASIVSGAAGDMTLRIERLRQAIAMQRARNEGNNFPFMIQELTNILINYGEFDEAEHLNDEAIAFATETFVPGHDGYRYRNRVLLSLYRERSAIKSSTGRLEEAERWLVRSDSILAEVEAGPATVTTRQTHQCAWGRLFLRQARYSESESALLTCRKVSLTTA